jgi:type 1 glutamine amidotransferase
MKSEIHFARLWLIVLLALPVGAADKPSILLVTGVDYPGHKWRETAPTLKRILEEDKRLDVRIVEDAQFLDSATLTNYAAVLLHFMNWETPGPGAAARENLRRYVEQGGGLMSVHFACGAWHSEWPEFQNIVGRVWHGQGPRKPQHDARGPFTVRIVDKNHAIARGLRDFETDDELYTCLTGDLPIQVIAVATSKVDKKDHPMGFVREYGKGRVFLTTLGHDVRAFTNSCVPQLMRQGCAWTANLSLPGGASR